MQYKRLNNYFNKRIQNQPKVLTSIVIILFSLITVRIFQLQILEGLSYRKQAEDNRIRLIYNPPIRGRLLDVNNVILADNKLVYRLSFQPHLVNIDSHEDLLNQLSNFLNIERKILDSNYMKGIVDNSIDITLYQNISQEQIIKFKEQEDNFYGVQVLPELVRYYPYGNFASHLIGYTQLITWSEYKDLAKSGYKLNDRIGRSGVEAAFEDELRGAWGGEMLEVNAAGVVQRSLGYKPPKVGKDINLTIDYQIQLSAERALDTVKAGAIVVLDPNSGAILAMASKPNFDPNFFTKTPSSQKEYERIFLSPDLPLLSRAINPYDPGSTWKVVTAVAGMESGKFDNQIKLKTEPCIVYGSHCFPEYNRRGFGYIGYEDALRVSSNTFFYQVGVGVGIEALYKTALQLGFDSYTGIELSKEESKGLVANLEWANEGRGWGKPGATPWIPEDIASASIGQSVVQITPLQLARAYAVFANGGYLITPHLYAKDYDWESSQFRKKLDIDEATLLTVRRGLKKVIESGTGMQLNQGFPDLPSAAGKSGTAEDTSTGGPDHAWFVAFAPYDDAEIVVVAFGQNTPGGGSVHALPMVREVLKTWYAIRYKINDPKK